MSWKIGDKGTVVCRKGDTPIFYIRPGIINIDNRMIEEYIPIDGDNIYMVIKKGEEILLTLPVDIETMTIKMSLDNTNSLKRGKYRYDMVLENKDNEYKCTFISNKPFIVI